MAKRKTPYLVSLKLTTPITGIPVSETLLLLESFVQKQIRLHTKHKALRPFYPEITFHLSSGKELEGVFVKAGEHAVTVYPIVKWVVRGSLGGTTHMRDIATGRLLTINTSSILALEVKILEKSVDPNELL